MVTEQILREHIGHKPFKPFRITLHDGRTLSVTQRNQAATLKRRMVVGLGNDQLQWIWHKEIARVEALTSQMT